jgi:hypothetical protein
VHLVGQPEVLVSEGILNEALAVPPGRYDVRILFASTRDQQTQWLRDIVLAEGEQVVYKVAFSSGELNVGVAVGAAPATDQVVVYVFKEGDHQQVITSMGARESVLITPGIYDIRGVLMVEAEEKEIRWRRGVPVEVGLQTKVKVAFQRGALLVNALNAGEPGAARRSDADGVSGRG